MENIKERPALTQCYIDGNFNGKYKVTELCRYVGITRQAYYNILNNVSEPRISIALKIVEYFNKIICKDDEYIWTINDLWKIQEVQKERG